MVDFLYMGNILKRNYYPNVEQLQSLLCPSSIKKNTFLKHIDNIRSSLMKHILQIYILLHLTCHRLGDNILQNILMVNKNLAEPSQNI